MGVSAPAGMASSDFFAMDRAHPNVAEGADPLRDEARAYADRLTASGVAVEYRCFEGAIHACMSFAGAIPQGLDALSFVASRLKNQLDQ